jgi:FMN phosphatase YigB (HAD superfamily)
MRWGREKIKMIRAITFDCWNTLIEEDGSRDIQRKEYFASLLKNKGFTVIEEDIDKHFSTEAKLFEKFIIDHRKTQNSMARVRTLLKLSGLNLTYEEINEAADYCDKIALEFRPPVIPGVKDMLEVFMNKYKMAVICNTGWHSADTVRNLLADHDFSQYFSQMTFSDEAAVAKPHKQIFEQTLANLSCMPEDAVHIGDSEYSDIIGAQEANMRAILFAGVNEKYKENNTADYTISSYENLPEILEKM